MITRLYPLPNKAQPLHNTYLQHNLHRLGSADKPFVYSAFISSLDSRVAVSRKSGQGSVVPRKLANKRDWRLFQELAAQADVIVISGSFMRDWANGKVKDLSQSDLDEYADLGTWRAVNDLAVKPDLAIVSASLNITVPEDLVDDSRQQLYFTTMRASDENVHAMLDYGAVYAMRELSGMAIIETLAKRGYRSIFVATGPRNLALMLQGNLVDRLYLTQSQQLLGGANYMSIIEGELFDKPVDLSLNELYLDEGQNQLFCSYDRGR